MPQEVDYSNTPTPDYTVEDLVKIITLKNPGTKADNEATYQDFINPDTI
jgi:hypothetical protein